MVGIWLPTAATQCAAGMTRSGAISVLVHARKLPIQGYSAGLARAPVAREDADPARHRAREGGVVADLVAHAPGELQDLGVGDRVVRVAGDVHAAAQEQRGDRIRQAELRL